MSDGHGHVDGSNKKIALLVAVLAAALAICEMGAKSSQTQALTTHIEASNFWQFFQARTIRRACRRPSRRRSTAGVRRRSATRPSRKPARGARS